ncbi:hypothetical protein HF313_25880 [Massilia atriviolacea]|uniref:Uncharacterized protein n=1 Tax=Massilia atriviolacea TaxID=2495579 RepID=A0A430HMW5_9BURK|nr:hypothetical protein [Massilia atriviolacea]RSZ58906.1 hypothetical protein EJB06_11215 [Massilia atriviolacea]
MLTPGPLLFERGSCLARGARLRRADCGFSSMSSCKVRFIGIVKSRVMHVAALQAIDQALRSATKTARHRGNEAGPDRGTIVFLALFDITIDIAIAKKVIGKASQESLVFLYR